MLENKKFRQKAFDFVSNKEKTFWVYPIIEGGAGSGFGGGLGAHHTNLFNEGIRFNPYYTIHINLDQRTGFTLGKPAVFELAGRPVSVDLGVLFRRYTGQNFFGTGNSSPPSDQSVYLLNQTDTAASMSYGFAKDFAARLSVGYSIGTSGHGRGGGHPSIEDMFPPAGLIGFQDWLEYIIARLEITHDTRLPPSLPESGGIRAIKFTRFEHIGRGDYNYNEYELAIKQFINLGKPRTVLTLNMDWLFQQQTGSSEIPFYRLATLDVNTPLRGFVRGRFCDRNRAIFNAEYRFPIWPVMDGVFFFDTGRVFHSITDFAFKDFKYSAGGGVRLTVPGLVLFRVDFAYGGEGINTIFGMSKAL